MNDEQQLAVAERMGGLIFKYLSENITDDELTELHNWAYSKENNRELFEEILHSREFQESTKYVTGIDRDAAFRSIQNQIQIAEDESRVVILSAKRKRYLVAAASILLLIAGTAVIYLGIHRKAEDAPLQATQTYKNDAAPGGDKAVLTLGNGSTIVLDNAQNGTLTQQGNTKVLKLASGQLAYTGAFQSTAESIISYNILSTPRGGQYQVVLPDGSKVWLNASSSLRYPTAFIGKKREVELTGEGYFEIAKNAAIPFKVKVNDMNVNVLGTQFNIMAYKDEEAVKTTLLSGSVKITQGNADKLIKPGDQAQIVADSKIKVLNDVDVDNVVAWKNGYFYFDRVDIKAVLRQLARWYDIQIEYEGTIPSQDFGGKIQRNLRLSQVLEILETNNVHFKMEGKKLTVLP